MQTKIRKVGNSLGIILPKHIIENFNLKNGDQIDVIEENKIIELIPLDSNFAEWAEAYREANKNFKNTLQELAK